MKLIFQNEGWEDYCYWQTVDKKTLRKINEIIRDIQRSPFDGIGKPEPLKRNLSGYWSRRIDKENRLVYFRETDAIVIVSCRFHYPPSR
jgi:toxin YoeB